MTCNKRACLSLVLLVLAACAAPTKGPETSMGAGTGGVTGPAPEEKPFQEVEVPLPPFPKDKDLIEFYARNRSPNRFFVDGSTLTVDTDRVVRLALVIRSSEGVNNVSYVGVKCKMREWKTYAYGRADGTWMKNERAEWKRIVVLPYNDYASSLADDYLCTDAFFTAGPVGSAKFIVRSLKSPPTSDARVGRKDYSEQRH